MSDLDYVKERMDEKDLYTKIAWAGLKATVSMVLIFFTVFILAPFALQYVTITCWISLVLTAAVMLFVFKADLTNKTVQALALIGSLAYCIFMYIGGEVVFIGLVLLGVLIVALFLAGDAILTGVFTYQDLLKWAKETQKMDEQRANYEAEKKAKEEAAKA
jgi:peptidoglycan/LPS O-acetylase OafA/YrhL